jgi:glycosyltransferase involved in cell wall biosynthesis
VLAIAPQALKLLWREVGKSDAVISIGPHPLSLPTALFALLRRRRLTLMVRQNYPEYIRHRLPSPRWRPFVTVASAADNLFRVLSRGTPTVVVGDELAHRYRAAPRLLNLSVSLMPAEVHGSHRGSGDADAPRLLSITRLDPEKSPHLLIEALALLNALQPERRARLTIAGVGELRPDIERLAEERVPGQVTFAGYVPHGEDLFELYRSHDLLVHTAKTEGVPQVVVEAQFVGLPVVATDVGGVRGAVGGGASALLVPVGDPKAIADSVISLLDDSVLRDHVVQAGLIATKRLTLQAQVDRLASFAAQPE